MSNHTHLMASLRASTRKSRAAKAADCPHRNLTKDQLWEQVQKLQAQIDGAAAKAARIASAAHSFAQESDGPVTRRRMIDLRDMAHQCAALARGDA